MRRPAISNLLLLFLALAVTALVSVAVWVTLSSGAGPHEGDDYPFPLTSEFPTVVAQDHTALETAAESTLGSGAWRLEDVGVLTLNGRRAGVHGQLLFEAPVELPEDTTFVVCGKLVSPGDREGPPSRASGLYVALLDGEPAPLHLLPMVAENALRGAGGFGPESLELKLDRRYLARA